MYLNFSRIIGKHVATSVAGSPLFPLVSDRGNLLGLDAWTALAPRIMGIGPALAIPKVLDLVGITKDDVDLYEINEAFASMVSLLSHMCVLVPSEGQC
jgi:hypothetical protein